MLPSFSEDCGDKSDFKDYLASNGIKYFLEYLQRNRRLKIIVQPQFHGQINGIKIEIKFDL